MNAARLDAHSVYSLAWARDNVRPLETALLDWYRGQPERTAVFARLWPYAGMANVIPFTPRGWRNTE